MSTIEALEAKNSFDSMLDRAEAGEEILITRHGKPSVRVSAAIPIFNRQAAQEAADRIRQRAKGAKRGPFDWNAYKAYRDGER